jgi:hypothetical protein
MKLTKKKRREIMESSPVARTHLIKDRPVGFKLPDNKFRGHQRWILI